MSYDFRLFTWGRFSVCLRKENKLNYTTNRRCDKISETQYKFIFIFFILLAIFKNLSHFKVKSHQTLRWRRLSTWQTCDKLVTNDKKMWQMVFCLLVWPNIFINLSQILSHGTKMWQTGDKICHTISWCFILFVYIEKISWN